jgi:hypothetical protein
LVESLGFVAVPSAPGQERWPGLVWLSEADGARAPDELLSQLNPAAPFVELVLMPRRPLRELMGLGDRPLERASLAQRRLGQYASLGICRLQQWTSIDPDSLLVTVGWARAGSWAPLQTAAP